MKLPVANIGLNAGTVALGAATVLLGPMVLTVAGGLVKTIIKTGIKGSLIMVEKGKVMAAEAKETVEDLAAEAKAEMSQSKKPQSGKK
jgi:polyhydroxyalkanoate synthesis regulator phasin